MDEQCERSDVSNKELGNIKNRQTQMKTTITEMKNTPEGINSRLIKKNGSASWKTEEWKSLIPNRKREKEQKEIMTAEETSETTSRILTFTL